MIELAQLQEIEGDRMEAYERLTDNNYRDLVMKTRAELDGAGVEYDASIQHDPNGIAFTLLKLPRCPFKDRVCGDGTWVRVHPDGVTAGCYAEKCRGLGWKDMRQALGLEASILNRVRAKDLVAKHQKPRPVLVDDLIRIVDIVNLVSAPKQSKSMWSLLLAISVASGTPFLGRKTHRAKVLLLDNELMRDDLSRRLSAIADKLGVKLDDLDLDIASLRGTPTDLFSLRKELLKLGKGTYGLVIVDAFYRTLPEGFNENDNAQMMQLYSVVDEIATTLETAVLIVHHSSKGAQHAKAISDIGSGAGSQSRACDVHVVLRPHQLQGVSVMEAITRSQKQPEPTCLSFSYPLWTVVDADPNQLAVSGRKPPVTLNQFVAAIPAEPIGKRVALTNARKATGCTVEEAKAFLAEAVKQGLVEDVPRQRQNMEKQIVRSRKSERAD